MRNRAVTRVAVVVIVVAAVLPLTAPSVSAQDGWFCGAYDQTAKRSRTPEADADGKEFPVVTIHGITGSDGDFDGTIDKSYVGANPQPPRTLFDALAGAANGDLPPGLTGAHVFSFSYTRDSLRWVDHAAVGQRFAETIDCLYREFGVPVSVVAHSMGGLVTRWVANTQDAAGVARSTKLGKVITLGTPYQGSYLSSLANGATDVLAIMPGPTIALLNLVCGASGTASGEGDCGPIPFYASFRSEAGRNLRVGSSELAALRAWPAGMDITTLAGSQLVPLMLLGSPIQSQVDLGDIAVATGSATADPSAGRVFTCSYDSASGSYLTRWKEVLGVADPEERRSKLAGAFLASPCYHSNLMRYVELTNEVLGQLTDWLTANRATTPTSASSSPSWDQIKNAAIPEMCTHPPATLVDGKDLSVAPDQGHFELVPTLPNGQPGLVQGVPSDVGPLTAVVVSCSAGGVGWPNEVMFFKGTGEYHAHADLYDGVDWEAAGLYAPGREGINGMWLRGDELEIFTTAERFEDPACCPSSSALLRMRAENGGIRVTSVQEDLGD